MNATSMNPNDSESISSPNLVGLTLSQRFCKRAFDIVMSFAGLLFLWPLMLIGWILATISTRKNGLFVHERIGLHGKPFPMYKLRSMRVVAGVTTTNTAGNDVRITRTGKWLRKLKIDELPQLVNVLLGHMSFVGARPDVAGYTDVLEGEDRILLTIRPGITGPASLTYRHEEEILAAAEDPEHRNDTVLWPHKVQINKEYIRDWSFVGDLKYILQTFTGSPMTIAPADFKDPS